MSQTRADTGTSDAATAGYRVLRRAVPPEAVERALRHLHLDIVRRGLPPEETSNAIWSAHWFPHLKWDPEIVGLADNLPGPLREGELCDPQILLHLPDDCDDVALESHVDETPGWANGRRYLRIVGIALTAGHRRNGGLVVWPLDGGAPTPVELEPGDAVVMDPELPHTSGLNRGGAIRYAVYFRYLEPG